MMVSVAQATCPVVPLAPVSPTVSFARFPDESRIWGSARVMSRHSLELFEVCEKMAGIVHMRCFTQQVYIVTDPNAIADVLVNQPQSFIKPYVLRRMKVLFGDGLLTSDGDRWKQNRHLVQPAFSAEHLPEFINIVHCNTEALISSWRSGEERDVYDDIAELCMKNVTQALFDVHDEELAGVTRELATTCHELVGAVFSYGWLLPFLWPGRLKRNLKQQLKQLSSYLDRLIEQRAQEPPRNDFLGILISGSKHHAGLSRELIRDEAVTILLAGHETSASAVIWALYLLATHPECADALAEELLPRLDGSAPSLRDLETLPLLRATLDESLRLYPPTHRIARTARTPVMIGGHQIPEGADVVIPQWAVHRSERWYDAPLRFRPERWTHEFRRSLPRFAYFPFSGGPRTCVGASLAWAESAIILGFLVQHFQFKMCENKELEPADGLTLVPGGGHFRVRLERRHTNAA